MKSFASAAVSEVESTLTTMLSRCAATTKRRELTRILEESSTSLAESIDKLATKKRSLSKTRKSVEVVLNTVNGMINGLVSESITLPELRSVCRDISNKSIPRITDALQVESESIAENEAVAHAVAEAAVESNPELTESLSKKSWKGELAEQWRDIQTEVRNSVACSSQDADFRKQLRLELESSRVGDYLSMIKAESRNLPTTLKGGYGVARLPIVPMWENPMGVTSAKLKALAVRHGSIGGYPVLEGQFVLLISKHEMQFLKQPKRAKVVDKDGAVRDTKVQLPSNQKIELSNRPMLEYARSVVEILNEHAGTTMDLVSERFVLSPKNTDHVCFWIMPVSKLNSVISLGKTIKTWSFPFDRSEFAVESD